MEHTTGPRDRVLGKTLTVQLLRTLDRDLDTIIGKFSDEQSAYESRSLAHEILQISRVRQAFLGLSRGKFDRVIIRNPLRQHDVPGRTFRPPRQDSRL